jgi:GntR family transcriptional regulator/MocR family aminotransferase
VSQEVPSAKIQLKGRFAVDRDRSEPLSLQIVRQLQQAIEAGRVVRGTQLPSSRSLARTLGVSRNTVLSAYEELAARGFVRSRPGAAMFTSVPSAIQTPDLRGVMRDAQYPSRTIGIRDHDGNRLYISYFP